ncbi:MAG: SAM-dependent methyltransferase [Legionellales bacterium]|nr:SAM-dependent methyltransferase [Legionellales bacterium]|tara:strand:+ start:91 stop:741 length:651 start_codon:yes stop_codon:yes gene_type:complete
MSISESSDKLISEACERNKAPIYEVLLKVLPEKTRVLEVASGSGQHADYFTAQQPGWVWQPTDISKENLKSIEVYQAEAKRPNFLAPKKLSVLDDKVEIGEFEVAFCSNLIHIAPWSCCVGMFRFLEKVIATGGVIVLYGPFFEEGVNPSESNLLFDQSLKERDSRWGIRSLKEVKFAAAECGFELKLRQQMPAHNLTLVFMKTNAKPKASIESSK